MPVITTKLAGSLFSSVNVRLSKERKKTGRRNGKRKEAFGGLQNDRRGSKESCW